MKTCHNCKYVSLSLIKDPCHTCCITVNSDGNHILHSLWEPKEKEEEPDCEKCKHEDKGPEEEPCQECGIDGNNYFEPKDAEKLCKNCGVKSIEDQMMVCTHCYDHNKWRPKEEKKMADTRKTKAQLMEELELKNAEIVELKKEMKRSEQYDLSVKAGMDLREAMDGLIDGGLTEEQAFAVILKNVK